MIGSLKQRIMGLLVRRSVVVPMLYMELSSLLKQLALQVACIGAGGCALFSVMRLF